MRCGMPIINIFFVLFCFTSFAMANMDPDRMDARWEQNFIRKNTPGKLVLVSSGSRDKIAISVHGINASPSALAQIMIKRMDQNFETYAFAWDSRFRRLGHSASDFASELSKLLRARPGVSVLIDAHSMGARMALVALGRMQKGLLLTGHEVVFNMIAPTLSGYKSANSAIRAPLSAQKLIKNLRPSMDMGTKSLFQKELDRVRIEAPADLKIYYAENDVTAPLDAKSLLISNKLNANLQVVEGADHSSILRAIP